MNQLRIKHSLVIVAVFLMAIAPFEIANCEGFKDIHRRDYWGIFEFLHYHSESAKRKEAISLRDHINNELEQDGSPANFTPEEMNKILWERPKLALQMSMIYPDGMLPTDCYRLAIEEVEQKDLKQLQAKYPKVLTDDYVNHFLFKDYYNEGDGPATITIPALEQLRNK